MTGVAVDQIDTGWMTQTVTARVALKKPGGGGSIASPLSVMLYEQG